MPRSDLLPESSSFALGQLRMLLDRDSYGPGERLPLKRILSIEMGIGWRSLRRAHEVLEVGGRIRYKTKGTFPGVRPIRPHLQDSSRRTNPLRIMDVRLEIEPSLALLAARAAPQDGQRLTHLANRASLTSDADAREFWDGPLHRASATASNHELRHDR